MKKLGIFLALLGLVFFFTACDDDDNNGDPNKPELAKIDKKHDNALLLVTFGSTWEDPHKTYKNMVAKYKEVFPDKDVYLSFTATTCIRRWGAKTGEYFLTPDLWLELLAKHKYKHITVQSMHVIPGEEYQTLKNEYVKLFKERHKDIPVILGDALLTSQKDINEVGDILMKKFKSKLDKGEAVAFMGHGNPKPEYIEENNVNQCYIDIEKYMRAKYSNIFVGTVDYEPMLIEPTLEKMKSVLKKDAVVNLVPLMSIAGDHANNDMAGDEDANEKPEDQSWKVQMRKAGYKIDENNCILKGLADYPEILDVWIRHTKEAK